MQINKVIVHELVKDQHQDIQPSNYRRAVLDKDNDAVVKLLNDVTDIYGSRYNSAHYGTFEGGEGRGAFPDEFERYKALEEAEEESFIQLSRVAMERLYDKASASPAATGGYILFSDYSSEQGRFFLTAMIKKTPGLTLTEELEPEELEQLDLNRLHQAARINFNKMEEYDAADDEERSELNYLSFISSTTSKSASGYFVTALGCAPGAASSRATDNLIRESKRFFRETEGLSQNREEFANELLGYLSDKMEAGESVKLSEVGHIVTRHIPDNMAEQADDLLENYMGTINGEGCAVPVEFPVSKRALNKYTRIVASGDAWKFSFDKSALGEDQAAEICYDRESQSVTLTRLPQSMIDEIVEALDEYEDPDE